MIWAIWGAQALANEAAFGLRDKIEMQAHQRLEAVRRAPEAELTAFTTDGCSGGLSATWGTVADLVPEFSDIHSASPPWEACCIAHDRTYHSAGEDASSQASFDARLRADETLELCVRATAEHRREALKAHYGMTDSDIDQAYDLISSGMFDAVRLGGGPCSGLPWRWGYGWLHCGVFSD